jgi:hypothetical protein
MKKQIIAILAASGMAVSAFAQGSINIDAGLASGVGVTTYGANAANPNTATTWFDGNISLALYYASAVTAAQLNAINALINTTGGTALSLLTADGFVQASTTTPTGSTVGTVTGAVSGGTISFSTATIGLTGVPTSTSGYLALVGTAVGGTYAGWSGVLAFANSTGGNPTAVPPGTAASLIGWNTLSQNLVLSSVPEPTTLALAALGGASLLLFRRKK